MARVEDGDELGPFRQCIDEFHLEYVVANERAGFILLTRPGQWHQTLVHPIFLGIVDILHLVGMAAIQEEEMIPRRASGDEDVDLVQDVLACGLEGGVDAITVEHYCDVRGIVVISFWTHVKSVALGGKSAHVPTSSVCISRTFWCGPVSSSVACD